MFQFNLELPHLLMQAPLPRCSVRMPSSKRLCMCPVRWHASKHPSEKEASFVL